MCALKRVRISFCVNYRGTDIYGIYMTDHAGPRDGTSVSNCHPQKNCVLISVSYDVCLEKGSDQLLCTLQRDRYIWYIFMTDHGGPRRQG